MTSKEKHSINIDYSAREKYSDKEYLKNILKGQFGYSGVGSKTVELSSGEKFNINSYDGRIDAYLAVCDERGIDTDYKILADFITNNPRLSKNTGRQNSLFGEVICAGSEKGSDYWKKYVYNSEEKKESGIGLENMLQTTMVSNQDNNRHNTKKFTYGIRTGIVVAAIGLAAVLTQSGLNYVAKSPSSLHNITSQSIKKHPSNTKKHNIKVIYRRHRKIKKVHSESEHYLDNIVSKIFSSDKNNDNDDLNSSFLIERPISERPISYSGERRDDSDFSLKNIDFTTSNPFFKEHLQDKEKAQRNISTYNKNGFSNYYYEDMLRRSPILDNNSEAIPSMEKYKEAIGVNYKNFVLEAKDFDNIGYSKNKTLKRLKNIPKRFVNAGENLLNFFSAGYLCNKKVQGKKNANQFVTAIGGLGRGLGDILKVGGDILDIPTGGIASKGGRTAIYAIQGTIGTGLDSVSEIVGGITAYSTQPLEKKLYGNSYFTKTINGALIGIPTRFTENVINFEAINNGNISVDGKNKGIVGSVSEELATYLMIGDMFGNHSSENGKSSSENVANKVNIDNSGNWGSVGK